MANMNELLLRELPSFFFVPKYWTDLFCDRVVEGYIDIMQTRISYRTSFHTPLPFVGDFLEEEEIVQICEKITCDLEYGADDFAFIDEKGEDEFLGLVQDNLSGMSFDIQHTLDYYKMSYMLGSHPINFPIKEVW